MSKGLTEWFTISAPNRPQLSSGNKLLFIAGFLFLLTACSPKVLPPVKQSTAPKSVAVQPIQKKVEVPQKIVVESVKSPIESKPQQIISLVLPFGLDNIDSKTASSKEISKISMSLDFYQGFKMALDSVAFLYGANFKLQVYDSSDDPGKSNLLTLKSAIKNSDLIVGPIFPNNVREFSNLSKALQIPLVSPLAPTNPSFFNNPYLITTNVTLNQHAYTAAAFIKESLKPKKVLLIRSGQAEEYKYAKPFKKGMDSLAKGVAFAEIGIKAVGYDNVEKYLTLSGLNVIVLPSTDRLFLETIFKVLDKLADTYQIAVIGHPNWVKTHFISVETLQKLNTYITSSYQINYKSSAVNSFLKKYRNKYQIEPSEYSFKGFDNGFYLASLMAKEGKNFFLTMDKNPFTGLHNHYNFIKDAHFGYFNNHIMVLKYQDFELVKSN
jgi:ABC-type branched-subunit amino acid transport system substrate-binding protein